MSAAQLYRCLADETRLRILNLLLDGPLCVCHLTEILGVPQPKVSRHLGILRECEALATVRCYNWTICRLPDTPEPLLQANLAGIRAQREREALWGEDLLKRRQMIQRIAKHEADALPDPIRELATGCC